MESHFVYFVGAGPGDPELLTLKGRRLLDAADVIVYAGSLVNTDLLRGVKAQLHDSASMTLEETTLVLKEAALAGRLAVRLHSGDISYYSAITEQISLLEAAGIACRVVPGVSSLGAGCAALGQELTIPEVSQTVIVTRMAGRTPVPGREALASLASHQSSMVIFLSSAMIGKVVEELLAGGYPPETPVAVVEKASWPEERTIKGSLADIARKAAEAGIKKTALIYVGAALGARICNGGKEPKRSKLYDKEFSHEYRDKEGHSGDKRAGAKRERHG